MTIPMMTRARDVRARYGLWPRIVRIVLVAIMLATSLESGCDVVNKLDKESDDLLDEINDPGGPSSSSSSSASTSQSSGLAVVERKDMLVETLTDIHGNQVEIWGQPRSSSTTPGHAETIKARAEALARTGKYEYITMQRSWRTATGRVSKSRKMPDIIGVRRDGKVDAYEVMSRTDKKPVLMQRLEEVMRSLPAERQGDYDVIDPDP